MLSTLVLLVMVAGAVATSAMLRDPAQTRLRVEYPHGVGLPFHIPRWVHPNVTRQDFAAALLRALGAPDTHGNEVALLAWMQYENTLARFNPMATSLDMPGSGRFNKAGVRNFASFSGGVRAIALTLREGANVFGYSSIIDALRSNASPYVTAAAIRSSPWGSHPAAFLVWEAAADFPDIASLPLGLQYWGASRSGAHAPFLAAYP